MTSTILVVDDEPDLETLVQQKFRRRIRDGQVRFLFARDGAEALEMLADRDGVDMVVSDINMPRMDGLTLLQKIQEGDDPLSTVIVSAYGRSRSCERLFWALPIGDGDTKGGAT
jgi:CheY-like chemotaxis protein